MLSVFVITTASRSSRAPDYGFPSPMTGRNLAAWIDDGEKYGFDCLADPLLRGETIRAAQGMRVSPGMRARDG